ncbi:hypothetical protein VNO77_19042 [Canavalia gladiata]|uniref:Uncharacterized protein n=1 Tax=Canavalia gladiata TaxID=3824 RepID=A0AAN9QP88_CANGL
MAHYIVSELVQQFWQQGVMVEHTFLQPQHIHALEMRMPLPLAIQNHVNKRTKVLSTEDGRPARASLTECFHDRAMKKPTNMGSRRMLMGYVCHPMA